MKREPLGHEDSDSVSIAWDRISDERGLTHSFIGAVCPDSMTSGKAEADMIDEMGTFRTDVEIAALSAAGKRRVLRDVMVDTGSEYNWVPAEILRDLGVAPVRVDRFETADGRILERDVGFALFFAAGRSTPAIAVFAIPGDLTLLGAHGLEGMNLRVDLVRRELVPAGPVPVAGLVTI